MKPQVIEHYRLLRELGGGGMGTVYEAEDLRLSRRVALKLIRPELARDRELEDRFLREARALCRISHPGIVQIYSFGVLDDGTSYLVMELLSGETLSQRFRPAMQQTALWTELGLVQQVAEVLAVLHQAGVLHRDLKPDNVMVVTDNMAPSGLRAKLVDFGLAKLIQFSGQRSASGLILGTPAYMSPEQCRGVGLVHAKTDCYALGVMLYELVAGRLPFDSRWAGDLLGMHQHIEPAPISQHRPDVDPRLAALIHTLLRKDKDERPTMLEASAHLGQLMGTGPQPGSVRSEVEPIPTDALARTQPGLPLLLPRLPAALPVTEVADRALAVAEAVAEPPARPIEVPPSQQYLDELFACCKQARVLAGGVERGELVSSQVLVTIEGQRLPELRTALLIREPSELRRCSCQGDFAIELTDTAGCVTLLSYHAHRVNLLRVPGWDRDASMHNRDDFLTWLDRQGVPEPARRIKEERRTRAETANFYGRAYVADFGPAPAWQPAPAQPHVPEDHLIQWLENAKSDEGFMHTAQCLTTQAFLGEYPEALPAIPSALWERMVACAATQWSDVQRMLLKHAQKQAAVQHGLSANGPQQPGSVTQIMRSKAGSLRSVVSDGIHLYCLCDSQILAIDPRDPGAARVVAHLPCEDAELSCCGPSLIISSRSCGWIRRLWTSSGRDETVEKHRHHPSQPFQAGWTPLWIEANPESSGSVFLMKHSEPTKRRALLAAKERIELADPQRMALISMQAPSLIGDDQYLYFLELVAKDSAQLRWMGLEGVEYEPVPATEWSAGTQSGPLLAQSRTHLFWPAGRHVLTTPKLQPKTQVYTIASGPIQALSVTQNGVFVLVGQTDEPRWTVEYARSGQAKTQTIGSFAREPGSQVHTVVLGRRLYFTCGHGLHCAEPGPDESSAPFSPS